MARVARFKILNNDAWYHLYSRIAGFRGHYPLSEAAPTRKLIDTIEHYTRIYFCEVAAFTVLGNHYHMVARFEAPRPVEEDELRARAQLMYPSKTSQRQIDEWPKEEWERFRRRLFDVSELMRNIQSAFARWYNPPGGVGGVRGGGGGSVMGGWLGSLAEYICHSESNAQPPSCPDTRISRRRTTQE